MQDNTINEISVGIAALQFFDIIIEIYKNEDIVQEIAVFLMYNI